MCLKGGIVWFIYVVAVQGTFLDLPAIQQVTAPVDHAEGPVWDHRKNVLYFVDIHAGAVLCYKYFTKELNSIHFAGTVGMVAPSRDNPDVLMVANNRSVLGVKWDGYGDIQGTQLLTTVANNFPTSRFNDGKPDSKGRLWFGTIGFENATGVVPNEGALYFITRKNLKNPTAIITPVTVSNGMAWNSENNKFYYIDSPTRVVKQYNYDSDTGALSNPKIVFNLTHHSDILTGVPDGMTIDVDDMLWIALYGGGAVIKVDPVKGALLYVVPIPARYVTSVNFGGPNMDVLFVTTSRYVLSAEERKQQPGAGSVFAITKTGTYGVKAFEADILKCGSKLVSCEDEIE